MSTTVAPAQPDQAQRKLAALAAAKVPALASPDGFERWSALVAAVIRAGGQAAATLAARQYTSARTSAGIVTAFTPSIAEPAPLEQISESLRWAAFAPGESTPRDRAAGVTTRLVMDAGRDTVVDSVAADDRAVTYARVPRPGCCDFCALLSTRRDYRSIQSALKIGTSDRPFHDHCACTTVPIFEGQTYTPPAHVQEAERLYAESTGGVSGAAKLTEFRKAWAAR